MSEQTEPVAGGDDKTVIGRACPKCNTINPLSQLAQQGYLCRQCGFELAYLDYTATGGVRQVLGWVQGVGNIIHDRYQVQAVLGRGGFGSTYLVSDLRLNGRRRALKEIPPNMFDDQEPMLLSKLTHPGIPDITDRFEYNNLVYMVLEFGGTHTMESKRKEFDGQIPVRTLLPWLCQLCDILDYLHTRTPPIIHRDLKPGNILLDENDRIRLIDFGIAKVANPTEATHTLGRAISQGFSSPEQIAGTGTDHRSDIYGLGATAYFLLSGIHPPSLTDRLSDKTVQRLIDLVPGLPPELDLAINKALDLNPVKRQQSVKDLWDLFDAFSPKIQPAKKKTLAAQSGQPVKGKSRLLVGIVAFIVLAAALAAGAYYFRPQGERVEQAKILEPEIQVKPSLPPSGPPEPPAKTGEMPSVPASSSPAQSAPEFLQGPQLPDTEVAAPSGMLAPPAMEQKEPEQPAAQKSVIPEMESVTPGTQTPIVEGTSVPMPPKQDVPPLEPKSSAPPADQPAVSAQPTALDVKKPEKQPPVPPKKKDVSARPKQTKRPTSPAPSVRPEAPPTKEQKPEVDWGGTMKWQDNQ